MKAHARTAVRLRPRTRASAAHRVAVFTSVDGTLLDARTFEPGPARAAVRRLAGAGVPVVPVTVMTLEEIAPFAADLGLQHAMIIEAGGAIARWNGRDWDIEPCGPPAEALLDVVLEIEKRSGADLLVYSALSESEAARLSGRSGALLRASTHRLFSEPFVIENGDLDAVRAAAASLGFSVRRGSRFLHLCRAFDQGEAFTRLREELQCDFAIGIGGAAIDTEFLTRADVQVIIPNANGEADEELRANVRGARLAPLPGPEGWTRAIEELWPVMMEGNRGARPA